MKALWAGSLCVTGLALASTGLETIVKIDSGLVSGTGVTVRAYKGIPYAAPPIGSLRWKAPQPAKPWKGVRVANGFGASCPQPVPMGTQAEDCLSLNVWTAARSANEKLPVMVWIHGGGFYIGASSQPVYDGEPLASKGVVLVSINYRLGVLGFLSHPALSEESPQRISGNYGLLDMIAALQWVKRNIAAFGGDPANVTIFGESAGGTAVCLLMVSPPAEGLFQKVISESAVWMFVPWSHLRDSWYGRVASEKFGAKLGADIAALRDKPWADVLKTAGGLDFTGDASERGETYMPVVDGVVLPDDPARLFQAGKFHNVALIAGTNADEGTLMGGPRVRSIAGFKELAKKQFGAQAEALAALYPAATDAEAYPAAVHASTDMMFLMGTRSVLRANAKVNPRTYQYLFTRVNGIGKRIKWGSFHAAEIPYVFGTLPDTAYGSGASLFGDFTPGPDSYGDVDTALAAAMSAAWVRFAKHGDPNGPGLAKWPSFSDGKESYLEFGDQIVAKAGLRKKPLDFMYDFHEGQRAAARAAASSSR